jgi:hypothetical protein
MGRSPREEWNAARLAHSKPSNRSRLCTCSKVDFITQIIISLYHPLILSSCTDDFNLKQHLGDDEPKDKAPLKDARGGRG